MRKKAYFLLLVFCLSLLPVSPSSAQVELQRPLEDSLDLMHVSDALLLEELTLEQVNRAPLLFAPAVEHLRLHPENAALAAAIHAQKAKRNKLDASYRLLAARLKSEGKDCEADRVRDQWQKQRGAINEEIGRLHQLRGDRRRWGTKLWHSIKRRGRSLWHRIGPVGRNFLRRLGPEVLQVVVSGGAINSRVLKILVKSTARSMARERIKSLVYKGVERLLLGQLDLARAAGVDLCEPGDEGSQEDQPGENTELTESKLYPDGAAWSCQDVQGHLSKLKEREAEWMKTLQSELDFEITYTSEANTLMVSYGYDVSEEWGAVQTDGTIGDWHVLTMNAQVEDSGVPVDERGVFKGKLEYEVFTTEYEKSWTTARVDHYWGLIPPGDYQTAYVCISGRIPVPEGLETLSPANVRQRCGSFDYYECSLDAP